MTNEEAMTHAKALKRFCKETDCSECPFREESKIFECRNLCRLTDYEAPPCGWELEASNDSN